jgi:hypothetical protein
MLDCHQSLDGVACWIDVVGIRRVHPDNRTKDPHVTCNVGRSKMIGEDGAQMILDRCTRISLGAVVSDEVAVLLEMGRLSAASRWFQAIRISSYKRRIGCADEIVSVLDIQNHSHLSHSRSQRFSLQYNNSMVGKGAFPHPFAGMAVG